MINITSDHGEEFGEHGRIGHPAHLYDENIHVPLIIHHPSSKGKRLSRLVSLIDLGPTLAAIAQVDWLRNSVGKNLLSPVQAEADREEAVLTFGDLEGEIYAYRTHDLKLIVNKKGNRRELYDLKNDPLEKKNLSNYYSEMISQLINRAQILMDGYQWDKQKQTLRQVEEEDEAIKKIRDLGYLE